MPRTTALECPGCPPLRALTFDALGLVKVVEARGTQGIPTVVDRWGAPDSSQCVLAASIADHKTNPILAVSRKNGQVELLNPLNGDVHVTIKTSETGAVGHIPEDDLVVGLHMFKAERTERMELSSKSMAFLTCTMKGNASLRSIKVKDTLAGFTCSEPSSWNVCTAGKILCSSVDKDESHALFGGKGAEINVWDLHECSKLWTAKSPRRNSLDIFVPTWFTTATFLGRDHRKIVAGTNYHQVRLYDISAQRRPVMSFDFRESPIKAVTEDVDGYAIYLGTGAGDLATFDMRTGKLLGCFRGKCSGSIRSIARHPDHPVIASCGLDSYLRFWDIKTRQLLSAVFLKQHLTSVVFDANFKEEESAGNTGEQLNQLKESDHLEVEDNNDPLPVKRKKSSKNGKRIKRVKSKKSKDRVQDNTDDSSS
ncbi:hypothetical protein MRB53_004444 [Persea americana]|uniref:Uncharacterized protein n=1 Tax=Persea americana TaxID=3435 RepID=A0ACC2MBE5_PERAE|nr:hypothetical protein MRB53_004444 [Persea americana]|eukprot:TRINITY_DN6029_c1_g1_i1.p1 TRINITY_DN6029_c1_g1~~TRINITY_DN6029_c1_g1_i1.p1  ORF type:complete len:424 (+),score=85.07 TRINITY_DN6029_c1_g1_i1:142-1413(+)